MLLIQKTMTPASKFSPCLPGLVVEKCQDLLLPPLKLLLPLCFECIIIDV